MVEGDLEQLELMAREDAASYALARAAECDERARWWVHRAEYWTRRAREGG